MVNPFKLIKVKSTPAKLKNIKAAFQQGGSELAGAESSGAVHEQSKSSDVLKEPMLMNVFTETDQFHAEEIVGFALDAAKEAESLQSKSLMEKGETEGQGPAGSENRPKE